jgi:hypothetical protein
MFDPRIGRWVEEDPIGFEAGDANPYRYVGNDPTNKVDPSGLEKEDSLPGPANFEPDPEWKEINTYKGRGFEQDIPLSREFPVKIWFTEGGGQGDWEQRSLVRNRLREAARLVHRTRYAMDHWKRHVREFFKQGIPLGPILGRDYDYKWYQDRVRMVDDVLTNPNKRIEITIDRTRAYAPGVGGGRSESPGYVRYLGWSIHLTPMFFENPATQVHTLYYELGRLIPRITQNESDLGIFNWADIIGVLGESGYNQVKAMQEGEDQEEARRTEHFEKEQQAIEEFRRWSRRYDPEYKKQEEFSRQMEGLRRLNPPPPDY